MNKQELAEFMAEKVLGWHWCMDEIGRNNEQIWTALNGEAWASDHVHDFIYSPEGFFAVWDVIDKGKFSQYGLWKDVIHDMYFYRKDRYEAFYNAVYEVMKDER